MPRSSKVIKLAVQNIKKEMADEAGGSNNIAAFAVEYCCKTCRTASFSSFSELKEHRESCNSVNDEKVEDLLDPAKKVQIACDKCKKRFKYIKSLQKHLKLEHSQAPGSVACKQCHVRSPNQKQLKKHIKEIHERELFKCQYCPATFVRNFHVLRHMEQKGCNGQTPKDLTCEICQASFSRKDNMMAHLRLHLLNKQFECKHCFKGLKSYKSYCKHVREEHMGSKFECDLCGKVTGSKNAMVKHWEIHGQKKYTCDECGYRTFTVEVLRRHALRHSADKPYKCTICPASFIQISQLRAHLFKHVSISCQTCKKTFSTKAKLAVHQKQHYGGNSYKCLECKVPAFTSEALFKEHLKSHEMRPFRCELCKKMFHSEQNLRRHVDTHSLERPRRCMYCVSARAYIRGAMLLRHVRVRHPDIFAEHLAHVRDVMGYDNSGRVRQAEMDSVLNLLDAVSDRILEQNADEPVLLGVAPDAASQPATPAVPATVAATATHKGDTIEVEVPILLSEEELVGNLRRLLVHLIDAETLACLGWPDESVDLVLEKMIEQCGQTPADKTRFNRVQCLRENTKHLFLHVVEDKVVSRMLGTYTIDQIVLHILKISGDDHHNNVDEE